MRFLFLTLVSLSIITARVQCDKDIKSNKINHQKDDITKLNEVLKEIEKQKQEINKKWEEQRKKMLNEPVEWRSVSNNKNYLKK